VAIDVDCGRLNSYKNYIIKAKPLLQNTIKHPCNRAKNEASISSVECSLVNCANMIKKGKTTRVYLGIESMLVNSGVMRQNMPKIQYEVLILL